MQLVRIEDIACADSLFRVFVAVHGSDSASRRAVFLAGEALLLEAVEADVIRHRDYSLIAYFQIIGSDLDSCLSELCDLTGKVFKVDRHTVTHDADDILSQNAGRQKVQDELAAIVYDGMTGVIASLISDTYVLGLAEKVNYSSLSLVSPVDSDNSSKHFFLRKLYFSIMYCGGGMPPLLL